MPLCSSSSSTGFGPLGRRPLQRKVVVIGDGGCGKVSSISNASTLGPESPYPFPDLIVSARCARYPCWVLHTRLLLQTQCLHSWILYTNIVRHDCCRVFCVLWALMPAGSEPTVFENYVHDIHVDDQLVELSLWDTAGELVNKWAGKGFVLNFERGLIKARRISIGYGLSRMQRHTLSCCAFQ